MAGRRSDIRIGNAYAMMARGNTSNLPAIIAERGIELHTPDCRWWNSVLTDTVAKGVVESACPRCGRKGLITFTPSRGGSIVRVESFPLVAGRVFRSVHLGYSSGGSNYLDLDDAVLFVYPANGVVDYIRIPSAPCTLSFYVVHQRGQRLYVAPPRGMTPEEAGWTVYPH